MFHISLQSLLYFARTFSERAVEIVDEAVNGGLHWYAHLSSLLPLTELMFSECRQVSFRSGKHSYDGFHSRPRNFGKNCFVAFSTLDRFKLTESRILQRDLQLFLLRSLQAQPEPESASTTTKTRTDHTPLLRIASDLLLLFHEHWRQGSYTVMRKPSSSRTVFVCRDR